MPATETPPSTQPDDDPAPWLRLQQTAGVGPLAARRLLRRFGLPANIFTAGFDALREVVPGAVAQALAAAPAPAQAARIEATLTWLAQPGNAILTLAHPDYPRSLLEIADPPLLLYVKGRSELLARPALAVVGSRNASAQGEANALRFAQALSEAGLTIVSGLALGIDTAAHQGGLRGAASSIAVIGTGADLVYPSQNRGLARLLAEDGCIISEYALGVRATGANFPRRNRLISGLARGVLVIEAAAHSGSLITARLAGEQGRDVFAIPGSIHSTLAKGCHALIKQGAKLVESAEDVLQELRWLPVAPCAPAATASAPAADAQPGAAVLPGASVDAARPGGESRPKPMETPGVEAEPCAAPRQAAAGNASLEADAERVVGSASIEADAERAAHERLLAALGHDPVGADLLAARAGLGGAEVLARLLALELAGQVERLPGGLFQRTGR